LREQVLVHKEPVALRMRRPEPNVLIEVKGRHSREIEPILTVQPNHLLIKQQGRVAGRHPQDAVRPFADELRDKAGRAAGMKTLAVAYRLAPEHPFPAGYNDALTAWRFLRNQGIDAAKIAIAGDSAGAGLILGLVGRLRDAHEELPACVWLISPWTDLTMSGSTLVSKAAADPLIHKEYLDELADAYLPAGIDRKDPRVSPLYADLGKFPSMLIQVGSEETLLDDSVRLAARAGAAEVAVTLEIWPQMIHAWPLWNAHLEEGRRAIANAGEFIRAHV